MEKVGLLAHTFVPKFVLSALQQIQGEISEILEEIDVPALEAKTGSIAGNLLANSLTKDQQRDLLRTLDSYSAAEAIKSYALKNSKRRDADLLAIGQDAETLKKTKKRFFKTSSDNK